MSHPQEVFLKDYKAPKLSTKSIDLYINIFEDHTLVRSKMQIDKIDKEASSLTLYGVDLELKSIKLNETFLTNDDYELSEEKLILNKNLQDKNQIEIEVLIHPEKNLSLEGLYKSGNIFCTQNEPEGFRKITYFQDTPDVLAVYHTTIEADKKKYPYLLANGNKEDAKDLEGGRHRVTWFDPHPKPSYLFAVVAGELSKVTDEFTTMSGRKVTLEIFVDPGNEDKCDHAMRSLKNAMKWDEERFGREYDLDIYMVVAVDSFNMGAMENKGLNIFNSAYVLAKKETATDQNFQGIEAVIGHEYFHNWTGNRVTCRDWFQLTLKEGLTVFRDQEFSADMLSRPVKRIDDVKVLRSHQFPEDAGPMAHPIKPKSYIEINNFYTATVYEKGAEIIRMMHTILGEENFRKGMDLYFKRHDGKAVTTEDFVSALSDASGIDLTQFKRWYDQVGTPKVIVSEKFDKENKTYTLSLKQEAKIEGHKDSALYMPLLFGLIDESGKELETKYQGKLIFKELKEDFTFENIKSKPILSLNRNFSAPIHLIKEESLEELCFLLKYETDAFNRYDTAQKLYFKQLEKLLAKEKLEESFFEAYEALLDDALVDASFSSYILNLPSLNEINETQMLPLYEENFKARCELKKLLVERFEGKFLELYTKLTNEKEFKLDSASMGKRALSSLCLSFFSSLNGGMAQELLAEHFGKASNMTDEIGALSSMVSGNHPHKEEALQKFYDKWRNDSLVLQKWFALQVTQVEENIFEKIKTLKALPEYDKTIPNIVRSVVHQFAMNNPVMFNDKLGRGYDFVANAIIEIDNYNPQLASRLAKTMSHKDKLTKERREHLLEKLNFILGHKLSNDTYEVISRNLNG